MDALSLFGALIAFLRTVPELISIYQNITETVGKDKVASFLKDLDDSTTMVKKSQDPTLSVDEKRKLRQDALNKSRDIWGRVTG